MNTRIQLVVLCLLLVYDQPVNGHQLWRLGPPPLYPLIETIPDPSKNRHYYVHWEALRQIPVYVNIRGAGDGLTWEETHAEVILGVNSWNGVSMSYMRFQDAGPTTDNGDVRDGLNVCNCVQETSFFEVSNPSVPAYLKGELSTARISLKDNSYPMLLSQRSTPPISSAPVELLAIEL